LRARSNANHARKEPVVPRQFLLTLSVPLVLLLVGTLGFHVIEGKSPLDSLYWTVVTVATIGYGDIVPRTETGKVFAIFLVLGGVFTLFYAATSVIRSIVSGEIASIREKRQMEKTLAGLKNHIIVCGYGRMGRLVCKEFSGEKQPFVVVDEDPELLRDFHMPHGIAYVGNATNDETIRAVGIERARGLVTVMASDAENLYATMSARLINANIFIVARVEDSSSEPKFTRAGANRVVSPYQIGGARVAQAVLRPTVVDFIELATSKGHIELQLEETVVSGKSTLVGQRLKDTRLRSDMNIIIVAIKKRAGEMKFNPAPETALEEGDILVAIGHTEHLEKLTKLALGE
jgi:voltage-gated potassium channel